MGIIDTHAHYDDEAFDADRDLLLGEELAAGNVECVVNVGASLEGAEASAAFAGKYSGPACVTVYAGIGIHPDDVRVEGDAVALVVLCGGQGQVADVEDLLSEAGFECMDWQGFLLECWMGVLPNGKWAAPSCGNEAPRQNGKTRVMCGRAAAEMLFYDGTTIYTAQLQKTSSETFEEMANQVEAFYREVLHN